MIRIAFLCFVLISTKLLADGAKYILFAPNKGRVISRVVIPEQDKANFVQANYFEKINGNPLIKIWIEAEINEENPPSPKKSDTPEKLKQ